jgi:hypothetical protein
MVRKSDVLGNDPGSFERWMIANLVLGSFLACGLVLMAIAAADVSVGPSGALADSSKTSAYRAPEGSGDRTAVSAYELMSRLAPEQLPVQSVNEQAF